MKNSYHVNILIPMASQIERSNNSYNKDHQSAMYEQNLPQQLTNHYQCEEQKDDGAR
jgi:hypothetical protein